MKKLMIAAFAAVLSLVGAAQAEVHITNNTGCVVVINGVAVPPGQSAVSTTTTVSLACNGVTLQRALTDGTNYSLTFNNGQFSFSNPGGTTNSNYQQEMMGRK